MGETPIVSACNIVSYDGYYGKFDCHDGETEQFISYGRDVRITQIFKCRDDGTYYVLIEFTDNDGERQKLMVPRERLGQPEFYEKLLARGADVNVKRWEVLHSYLNEQFRCVKPSYGVHKSLGWSGSSGGIEYRSWRSTKGKSRYIGSWDVERVGKFKPWRKMVREKVLPHDNLSVVLLAALSAPISAVIAENFNTGNPIYSIAGNSTSGKTTAGILAASTLFNPRAGSYNGRNFLGESCTKTGGVMTWSATANAMISRLREFSGVVAVIDELSKYQEPNMSRLVYVLSEGVDKVRMGKDLSMRDTAIFNATIISIGEERLTDRCKSDRDGVRIRILEIDGNLTRDAEHSHQIVSCCQENYGHATPRLAKWIINNGGTETVIKAYRRWTRAFAKIAPDYHYASRRIETFYAPLMVTAELCKDALKLDFDLERLQLQRDADKVDLCTRAYHDLISYVAENIANFDPTSSHTKHFGRIYEGADIPIAKGAALPKDLVREVAIRPIAFERFMQQYGYGNKTLILQAWKSRGLLNAEEGKLYRKRKLDGITERVYVIRLFDEPCSEEDQPKKRGPLVLNEADLDDLG